MVIPAGGSESVFSEPGSRCSWRGRFALRHWLQSGAPAQWTTAGGSKCPCRRRHHSPPLQRAGEPGGGCVHFVVVREEKEMRGMIWRTGTLAGTGDAKPLAGEPEHRQIAFLRSRSQPLGLVVSRAVGFSLNGCEFLTDPGSDHRGRRHQPDRTGGDRRGRPGGLLTNR
jgi:hypothetical protein